MNNSLSENQIRDSLIGVRIDKIEFDEHKYPVIHTDKSNA